MGNQEDGDDLGGVFSLPTHLKVLAVWRPLGVVRRASG